VLFNSIGYFIFLPVVFCLYWFVFYKSLKWQNILILTASYFFYGWWNWKFVFLLASSTCLDYFYAFGVASTHRNKAKIFLWLSIFTNVGILGIFKYYNFFAIQLQHGFKIMGLQTDPILLDIALPLGISFYTFHGMSYVIDIYRQIRKPVHNIVDYAVFVSFFPLLIAGPIERANHLLPQVQKKRLFNYQKTIEGCRLILWGMFKKVVIADSIAATVDTIYRNYQYESAYLLIIAAVGFSFQIYADFSGYSDIAIGSAKLLGFELLSNFRFPFFSHNISEFWRRWHISLSTWFQDYLFLPLLILFRKLGIWSIILAVFITFFFSGLWHGAAWKFIFWGCLNGLAVIYDLLTRKLKKKWVKSIRPGIYNSISILLTFAFNVIAWIFFRSSGFNAAIVFFKRIATSARENPGQFLNIPHEDKIFAYIIPFIILDWIFRKDERALLVPHNKYIRYLVYSIFFILVYLFFAQSQDKFIYFQF